MIKLYIKETLELLAILLISLLLIFAVFYLFYLFVFSHNYLALNSIPIHIKFLILLIVNIVLLYFFNKPTVLEKSKKLSYRKWVCYKIFSKENLAKIFSIITVLTPLFIYAGISEKTPLWIFILGTLLLWVASVIIYEIILMLIWSLWYLVDKKVNLKTYS